MILEIRLFAQARDLAGAERVCVELPQAATVADLRTELAAQYNALAPLAPNLLIAIGVDYAAEQAHLHPGDEIACFPPVSGG